MNTVAVLVNNMEGRLDSLHAPLDHTILLYHGSLQQFAYWNTWYLVLTTRYSATYVPGMIIVERTSTTLWRLWMSAYRLKHASA